MDEILNKRFIRKIPITDFMIGFEYSFEEDSKKDEGKNRNKRTMKR